MNKFATLETQIEEKCYVLLADAKSEWPHVKQALADLMKIAGNLEDQQNAAIAAQQAAQLTTQEQPSVAPATEDQVNDTSNQCNSTC